MDPFATSHFSDRALLLDVRSLDAQDRRTTAVLLSRLAEVEERELYLREGQPTMYAYCVRELHYCEGTASRRIYAARTARRFPVLLVAIAEGRLHLTGVLMLSRYLTSGNVDELLAAATHKSKAEIALLIAERFPRPDLPEVLRPIAWPPIPAMVTPGAGHSLENVHSAIPPVAPSTPNPAREHLWRMLVRRSPRPRPGVRLASILRRMLTSRSSRPVGRPQGRLRRLLRRRPSRAPRGRS